MTRATLLAALLLAATGCVMEEGPMMMPGSSCLECHGGRGGEESGPTWTFAGTLPGMARRPLLIQDAAGKTFTRPINEVGNFWSSEPVTFPLRVSVDGAVMPGTVSASGANCNSCHGFGDGGGGG
jgi:hypothetical protein